MSKKLNKVIPIIYCRVSSERQKREGGGLESQEQRCRKYCIENGYGEPEGVFKDSFSGGGDYMKRPAMRELLAYLDRRTHKQYVIVFDDIKRLARDTVSHLKLRTEFKMRGCDVESPNFKFEETPEGLFIETMFAAQGELERTQNKRQVMQKQMARLERGFWAFRAVNGYEMKKTIDGNVLCPNGHSGAIKEGLEGFANKRFVNQIDLARFWQEKGVFPKKRSAEKYLGTTKKMLLNPLYAGFVEYKKWEVERRVGRHEPLISPDVLQKNNSRIFREKRGTRIREDLNSEFELRGLVCCAGCGEKLRGYFAKSKTGDKHPYYECKTVGCNLRYKTIKRLLIEDGFKHLVAGIKAQDKLIDIAKSLLEDVWNQEALTRGKNTFCLKQEKERIEDSIRKYTDEMIETKNEAVKKQLAKRIEEKSTELDKINSQLSSKLDFIVPYRTSLAKVEGMLKNPYAIWKKADINQKQNLFFFMFERHLVYERGVGYRTPENTCITRLFEGLSKKDSALVEMGGVEPPCREAFALNTTNVSRLVCSAHGLRAGEIPVRISLEFLNAGVTIRRHPAL